MRPALMLAAVGLAACGSNPSQARNDAELPTSDGASDGGALPPAITHGEQLTKTMVGPTGLGVALGALRKTPVGGARLGTYPTDGLPPWIPSTPYVLNNDPHNHGGVVGPGGMVIDGFEVPQGTWVAQFDDFGADAIIINGDNGGTTPHLPGIVFRGCSWRGPLTAPGPLNVYASSHTAIWILFSDAGGLGATDAQYNEVAFKLSDDTTSDVYYRNYISYTTTAIQPGSIGPQIIENYVEKITYYYNGGPPPGETGGKHLNGISINGGQTHVLVARNKVLLQSPDDAGRTVDQTDCIYFKQEPGMFPGTGHNLDGSVGYQVKNNYIGGGGYSVYAGWDASYGDPPAPGSLVNMVIDGNKLTTQWWPKGGALGPIAKEPVWGQNGNQKTGNTFAESGLPW